MQSKFIFNVLRSKSIASCTEEGSPVLTALFDRIARIKRKDQIIYMDKC